MRFERDALGRIVATTYPSGTRARYFHDLLGNRRLAEYDSGASISYRHDPAGNIVAAEARGRDGAITRQTTTVGPMNRVERIAYDPGPTLEVAYDGMGRPTTFDDGTQRVVVEYGATGAVRRLSVPAIAGSLELNGQPPPGVRPFSVRRLAVLSRDVLGPAHPDYGPLRFAETTFHALPLDAAEAGVPNLTAARDLFAVALPLYGGTFDWIVKHFEKPSNPAFQPAEYRSTNCCVAYGSSECNPLGPIDYSGGGSGAPNFQELGGSVDQCMRDSVERIDAISPHELRFEPPEGGWAADEVGRMGITTTGKHVTYLNEALITKKVKEAREEAGENEGSVTESDLRAAIQDVLAHEYAHHILASGEHSSTHVELYEELKDLTTECF